MRPTITTWLLAAIILMSLPLAGIFLHGQNILVFLEFPPLTRHVVHPPFSWIAFSIIAVINVLVLAGTLVLGHQQLGIDHEP